MAANTPQAVRVALTVDMEHPDRPHGSAAAAGAILDVLGEAGVPATCFLQGRWVEGHPALATRVAAAGHRIGHHSYYHARLTSLSEAGLADDIERAERTIREVTGADPRPWFRCPFGDGWDVPWIRHCIAAAGYRQVGWDVDVEDWDGSRGASDIADAIVRGVAGRASSVVLLHGWPAATPAGLEGAIRSLRAAGAVFVTLDALDDAELPEGWPADVPAGSE